MGSGKMTKILITKLLICGKDVDNCGEILANNYPTLRQKSFHQTNSPNDEGIFLKIIIDY